MSFLARRTLPVTADSTEGCSYAVRVGDRYLPAALDCLRAENLLPMRVFLAGSDGAFSEVFI